MTFQLDAVVLYSRTGERRDVHFRPGVMNVITGGSQTGKTALLAIIDYVTGGGHALPAGPVRDAVDWYGVALRRHRNRLFVGRKSPEPGRQSTEDIYVDAMATEELPAADELAKTTNEDGLVSVLSAFAGIDENEIQTAEASARPTFAATIRHALWFCLQRQDELLSQRYLFHEQGEPFHAQHIRDVLPYFLGAVEPGYVSLMGRLRRLRRDLAKEEARLRRARASQDEWPGTSLALAVEAAEVGLLEGEAPDDAGERLELLRGISWQSRAEVPQPAAGDLRRSLESLRLRERELRDQSEQVLREVEALRSESKEFEGVSQETAEQHNRLESLGLLTNDEGEHGSRCPLCSHTLDEGDTADLATVRAHMEELSARISQIEAGVPSYQEAIEAREERLAIIRSELRDVRESLQELVGTDEELRRIEEATARQAHIAGRIAMFLQSLPDESEVAEAQARVRSLENEVQLLEERTDLGRIRERMNSSMSRIAQSISRVASQLDLEHSEWPARLDLTQLTVAVDGPEGPIRLADMGSAENWLGYHVAAHLALHEFFVTSNRPVPRFLFLDQPSLVYFPGDDPEAITAPEDDEDTVALTRLLRLVYDWTTRLGGEFQVIMTEHANLQDPWYQEAVVETWRQGEKLVPSTWL